MSTPSTLMPREGVGPPARVLNRGKVAFTGLTFNGVVLFLIGFLVLASGYLDYRPTVMGLRLHPYLIPLGLAFPLAALARIAQFPPRVLAALLVFASMYSFSVLSGGRLSASEIFKIFSGVLTIITCALLVRRRGDFVAGSLGLCLAVVLLAWPSLQTDPSASLEVMEGANKNSYSLFALPAMLLAGFISTRMPTVPKVIKVILIACVLPSIVVIFMSANRSGYLGTVFIGFLLFWDRRGRGMFVVAAVTSAVVFWMSNYVNTSVFEERMEQTVEGTGSDELRIALLRACGQIAIENPIIGVSPSELPWVLARRVKTGAGEQLNFLDAHNVFGHVAGGSGLICLAALLAVGLTLWTLKPAGRTFTGKQDPARQALSLLRMMLVLWVMRGMFTREILYNPSCNIALGLCIGLFIVAQQVRPESNSKKKSSPSPLPAGGSLALPPP